MQGVVKDIGEDSWQEAASSGQQEVRGQKSDDRGQTTDSYSSIGFYSSGSWLLSTVSSNLDGVNDLGNGRGIRVGGTTDITQCEDR